MTKFTAAYLSLALATFATAAPSRVRLPRQDAAPVFAVDIGAADTGASVSSTTTIDTVSADAAASTAAPVAATPLAALPSAFAGGVPTTSSSLIAAGPGLLAGGPGALFWQTNDPVSNVVFSANLDANGKMTFGGAFSTGGRGSHIGPDDTKPNALASQASVKVVDDKLVVVNAGSDTAALYQIDFQNPALIRMIGLPVSTMGSFPTSSTINPINHNVCVLNAGDINGVCCYKIDLRKGLVVIPNTTRSLGLNITTPPANEDGTPSQIVFSGDGLQLFVSVKASGSTPGFLATWDVAADGSLSTDFARTQGGSPASLTAVRGAHAILHTDTGANGGITVVSIANGSAVASPPTAQPPTQIPGAQHAAWSEFSDATRQFYVSDPATDQLTELAIDPATLSASVTKQYPLPAGSGPTDQEVALIDAKDTIYLLCPGTSRIETLDLVAKGDARPKQSFDIAEAARTAGVPLNPNFVQGVNAFFTG